MSLSRKIFWDIDFDTLDYVKHKNFIIERVLNKGGLVDWNFIKQKYGLEDIRSIAPRLRSLDRKTAVFASNLFNIPLKEFRCFTQIQ